MNQQPRISAAFKFHCYLQVPTPTHPTWIKTTPYQNKMGRGLSGCFNKIRRLTFQRANICSLRYTRSHFQMQLQKRATLKGTDGLSFHHLRRGGRTNWWQYGGKNKTKPTHELLCFQTKKKKKGWQCWSYHHKYIVNFYRKIVGGC